MSDNYIVINGKRIDLTEDQLETLGIKVAKDPFSRVDGKSYHCIDSFGSLASLKDTSTQDDILRHSVANYCSEPTLLQQQAYREALNRLLWRYSMRYGGDEINLPNLTHEKRYFLVYRYDSKSWVIDWEDTSNIFGSVYFKEYYTALSAIDEVIKPFIDAHPDFIL